MHKLGNTLAFITNKIFVLLLIIIAIALTQTLAIASVVTNKDIVKNVLTKSDIYSTIPQNAIYLFSAQQKNENASQTADQQSVYDAIEKSGLISPTDFSNTVSAIITPDYLQKQTENVIDQLYANLSGETKEFTFSIDLQDRATIAQSEINILLTSKLAALPQCTTDQLITQNSQDISIIDAVCLPAGVSLQAEVDKFSSQLTSNDGVLAKNVTQKDLGLSNIDTSVGQFTYSALRALAWLYWLLLILCATVVVVTAKTLHRGFKVVGGILLGSGLLLIIAYAGFISRYSFTDTTFLQVGVDSTAEQIQAVANIVAPLLEAIAQQLSSQVTVYAIILIVLGAASFAFGIFASKHHIEHLYIAKNKEPVIDTTQENPQSSNSNI